MKFRKVAFNISTRYFKKRAYNLNSVGKRTNARNSSKRTASPKKAHNNGLYLVIPIMRNTERANLFFFTERFKCFIPYESCRFLNAHAALFSKRRNLSTG